MSHFARINENNIVTEVIVAEQDFINTGILGDPSKWIQTSYNTYGGEHLQGRTPLRKNYAGIGMIYDPVRDAFYWPMPENSGTWILNEQTCLWERPIPMPNDAGPDRWYVWNESAQQWQITTDPLKVGGYISGE